MAYVYRHIRLDNSEPFYVGVSLGQRSDNYKRSKTKHDRNIFWNRVVNKTEWYSEIIIDGLSDEDALLKESEFIKLYGRANLGLGTLCNLTDGGRGNVNFKVSEETKKQLSIANVGKILSEDHRKKISEAHKGKVFSEESKSKMSLAKIGKFTMHNSKPIIQLDNEIAIANYASIAEMERQTGMSRNQISLVLTGKNKTAYGFKWKYKI